LGKKGISVWLFSSLTFAALVHVIEAISVVVFNSEIKLLKLYPLINGKMGGVTPTAYFWTSATATFILWGITCAIAFESPVESFLNNMISDAKKQGTVEAQLLEEKGEILDAMNLKIESSSEILTQVRDLTYNIRTEVKEVEPLKDGIEKIKTELSGLKKEFKRLEESFQFTTICLACGKPLMPEFKICPYCGETAKTRLEEVIPIKSLK